MIQNKEEIFSFSKLNHLRLYVHLSFGGNPITLHRQKKKRRNRLNREKIKRKKKELKKKKKTENEKKKKKKIEKKLFVYLINKI